MVSRCFVFAFFVGGSRVMDGLCVVNSRGFPDALPPGCGVRSQGAGVEGFFNSHLYFDSAGALPRRAPWGASDRLS